LVKDAQPKETICPFRSNLKKRKKKNKEEEEEEKKKQKEKEERRRRRWRRRRRRSSRQTSDCFEYCMTHAVSNMFVTSIQFSENTLSPNTFVITSFQLLSRMPGKTAEIYLQENRRLLSWIVPLYPFPNQVEKFRLSWNKTAGKAIKYIMLGFTSATLKSSIRP
jgi:hypothetical protein